MIKSLSDNFITTDQSFNGPHSEAGKEVTMSDPAADTIELLSSEDVSRTIARIAHQIIEKTAVDSTNAQPLLLLGIPSGGVPLARRLAEKIHQFTGVTVPVGSLDITLYRDDLRNKPHRALQKTNIPIDKIDGTNIILVDDVLFSGRSIRAALDALIIRHSSSGAAQQLAQWVAPGGNGPSVINAGDGAHQHPTQALLDAVTMRQRIGEISGKKIVIVGDCLHSRVVRSNVDLLSTLGAEVVLVAPPTLMPTGVENWPVRVSYTMDPEIADADVVMMLRVQQERMQGGFFPSHREYSTLYGMSKERESRMKDSAIIMHPGPMLRGMEINYTVADAPRTAVLQQVSNGVHVRMAVLFTLIASTDSPGF